MLLRNHYGMITHDVSMELVPNVDHRIHVNSLYDVYKILGAYMANGDGYQHVIAGVTEKVANEIISFVRLVAQNGKKGSDIASPCWPSADDWLYQSAAQEALRQRLTPFWQVTAVSTLPEPAWALFPHADKTRSACYLVTIPDPLFVLEVITASHMCTIQDVVLWLLEMGAPFWMFVQRIGEDRRPASFRHTTCAVITPRIRPSGFQFTINDYNVYVESRTLYLLNHPRVVRGCLLAGGILWRLAVHLLDQDAMMSGPMQWAHFTDSRVDLTFATDEYVDDVLAEDEVDFIVSKYAPTLSGVLSWWPNPGQFNSSPYWRSWWSKNAKDFFQSCLALFCEGHNFSDPENAMPMSRKK
jgi:hypothetical protein